MPYIKQSEREHVDKGGEINTAGQLNYVYYKAMLKFWNVRESYQTIHDIYKAVTEKDYGYFGFFSTPQFTVGDNDTAMELAFKEFYRRIVIPYETKKMHLNGDILINGV